MATSKKTTEVVQERIEEDKVTLTLEKDEALALRAVLACVGGSDNTARGKIDKIRRALDDVGVTFAAARKIINTTNERDHAVRFEQEFPDISGIDLLEDGLPF